MFNLYKGVVHPWLCDAMGHMNVRHYLGIFDDAHTQLVAEAFDYRAGEERWRDKGWADVSNQLEYKRELQAGALIEVNGGIVEVGRSSFTSYFEMKERFSDEVSATMTAKIIFFDLKARKSMPLTEKMLSDMKKRIIQ